MACSKTGKALKSLMALLKQLGRLSGYSIRRSELILFWGAKQASFASVPPAG
jgi:hypothetical protein